VALAVICGVIPWRIPSATHAQATDTPVTPGLQQFAGWTERVCLSADHDQAGKRLVNGQPCIVGQGDHLIAFWLCGYGYWAGDVFPRPGPWLAKAESTDGGSTWSPARWVTPFIVEWFRLQWGQNTVHLAYSARIDPAKWSTSEVFYARSDDNGDTWSTPAQLSFSPHKDLAAYSPAVLAEDDTTVHVAWHQQGFEGQTAGVRDDEIRYRRSDDGGVTWGTTRTLGLAQDNEAAPVLWFSGGALWAAFAAREPFDHPTVLCATRDRGRTWSPAQPVPFEGPLALQRFCLPWGLSAVAGGSLTVFANYPPGGALICANVDPERGVTSLLPVEFTVVSEGGSHAASLFSPYAVPGGLPVYAVCVCDREIHLLVYNHHVVSPDGGRSWSLPTPLPTTDNSYLGTPAAIADSRGTHMVWVDKGAGAEASVWYVRRPPSDEVDMIPPAPVRDLSARRENGKIVLRWTAPGDDGTVGTASRYFVRYNQTPLASENWQAALDATGEPEPAPAGTAESMEVAAPLPAGTYHFGIISQDDVGNVSLLSNDAALDVP
jgi:hypothetical protein